MTRTRRARRRPRTGYYATVGRRHSPRRDGQRSQDRGYCLRRGSQPASERVFEGARATSSPPQKKMLSVTAAASVYYSPIRLGPLHRAPLLTRTVRKETPKC